MPEQSPTTCAPADAARQRGLRRTVEFAYEKWRAALHCDDDLALDALTALRDTVDAAIDELASEERHRGTQE